MFVTPSLCILSASIFSSSSCSSSDSPLSSHPLPLPPWPLLCCGGPQKRSGQMVSDDFRALLISTGNSLVLLLAWCSLRVSAGPRLSKFNSVPKSFRQSFDTVLVWIIFGNFRLILTQLWNSGPYPVYFGVSKYDVLILTWHLQTPCIFCLNLSLLVLCCHICVAFVLAVLVVRRLLTVGKCHFPCDPSKWCAIACRLYTHPSVLFIHINQRSCYVCICMCQSVEYKILGLRHNLHLFLLASWWSWCFTHFEYCHICVCVSHFKVQRALWLTWGFFVARVTASLLASWA